MKDKVHYYSETSRSIGYYIILQLASPRRACKCYEKLSIE